MKQTIFLVVSILLCCFCVSCGTNSNATNDAVSSNSSIPLTRNLFMISIEKLILLNNETKDNIESFLKSKHFDHTSTQSANGMTCTMWGFLYGDEKSSDPISARVDYCVTQQGTFDGLSYWIFDQSYYFKCLNEIDKLGFTLFKENYDNNGDVSKIYTNEQTKTVLIVNSKKAQNGKVSLTGYSFSLMDWNSFQKLIQNKQGLH